MAALTRFALLLLIGWTCFGLVVGFLWLLRVATDALYTILWYLAQALTDLTQPGWLSISLFPGIGLGS